MILQAPVAALACEWQCARDAATVTTDKADLAQASGESCHRPDEAPRTGASLRAPLHDCGMPQANDTASVTLSAPPVTRDAPVAAVQQPRFAEPLACCAIGPLAPPDRAPPGRTAGLITPLRI
ncbi:hypothetical protein BH23ACI1_BH23ACI1_30110 [soil metagenome]